MTQQVIIKDLLFEAAKGKTPFANRQASARVFNPPVGQIVTVWPDGVNGTRFHFGHAGSVVTIVSTSPDDTALGTGMRSVNLDGVGTVTQKRLEEDVLLNGTTPVTSLGSFLSLDGIADGNLFGSVGAAVGRVTFTISGFLQSTIEPGDDQSFVGAGIIPLGSRGFLYQVSYSSTGPVEFSTLRGVVGGTIMRVRDNAFVDNDTVVKEFSYFPQPYAQLTRLEFIVKALKPNINCAISRSLIMFSNELL